MEAWAKGDKYMYEYVKKSEYAPVRKELEQIIKRTQIEMRKNYGLKFQFRLIGSGKDTLSPELNAETKDMISIII